MGRRLRKRCRRSVVWLPAVTVSIDVGLGWCLRRDWVPAFAPSRRAWVCESACQNRPELRPIRLPALLRLRRRRYASCRAPKIGRVKCVEPSLRQLRDARTASLQLQTIALSSTASVLQALQATSTSQRVLDDKKSLALNCTCAVSLPSPRLDNYSLSAASKQCIFLTA